jgi:hypothetical protein
MWYTKIIWRDPQGQINIVTSTWVWRDPTGPKPFTTMWYTKIIWRDPQGQIYVVISTWFSSHLKRSTRAKPMSQPWDKTSEEIHQGQNHITSMWYTKSSEHPARAKSMSSHPRDTQLSHLKRSTIGPKPCHNHEIHKSSLPVQKRPTIRARDPPSGREPCLNHVTHKASEETHQGKNYVTTITCDTQISHICAEETHQGQSPVTTMCFTSLLKRSTRAKTMSQPCASQVLWRDPPGPKAWDTQVI